MKRFNRPFEGFSWRELAVALQLAMDDVNRLNSAWSEHDRDRYWWREVMAVTQAKANALMAETHLRALEEYAAARPDADLPPERYMIEVSPGPFNRLEVRVSARQGGDLFAQTTVTHRQIVEHAAVDAFRELYRIRQAAAL